MNLIKSIFFFYLLAASSFVFAENYYWARSGFQSSQSFPTAELACRNYSPINSGFTTLGFAYIEYRTENTFSCYYSQQSTTTGETQDRNRAYVIRYGTSCSEGTTYNSATGACDAPEENVCQLLKGERTTYYVKTQLNGDPPSTIDLNGCEATFGGVITCGNRADGYGVCTGFATITGEETPQGGGGVAGDGVECSGDDCLAEAPEPFSKEIPCVYVSDPDTGAKVCSGSTVFDKPGKVTCDQANGEWQCREDPLSTSVEKKTDSKIEEKNNLDGSSDTTKTDKTTVTTCKGIKNCTTTDKTTVEKGGTAPDGSDKGKDTECTGKACNAPDDVEGDLDEGEDDTPAPTIDTLEKPKEKADFDDANDEWDKKIETAKEELKSKSKDITDLFQPLKQINLASGGAELPCGNSFEVLGQSMSICFSKYSEQLLPLAAIILFICTVIALFIVFKD